MPFLCSCDCTSATSLHSYLDVAAVREGLGTAPIKQQHYASPFSASPTAQVARFDALPEPVAVQLTHFRTLPLTTPILPHNQELQILGVPPLLMRDHAQCGFDGSFHFARSLHSLSSLQAVNELPLCITPTRHAHLPNAILPHHTAMHRLSLAARNACTACTARAGLHPPYQCLCRAPVAQLQHGIHGAGALVAQEQTPQAQEHINGQPASCRQRHIVGVRRGSASHERQSEGAQERRAGVPDGRGVRQGREQALQVRWCQHAVAVFVVAAS